MIAGYGFDVLLVDMEHTSIGLETLEAVIAAVGRWDPVTIVRVPGHDPSFIKRCLDIGIDGIMVPQVMDAEQARRLVAAVKYPPQGGEATARGAPATTSATWPISTPPTTAPSSCCKSSM